MSHQQQFNSPPSDVAVYTNFFRTLAIPQLIDRTLQRLYEHGPTRARDALDIFLSTASQSQEWYYKLVVSQFEQAVHRVEHQGFTGAPHTLNLRFAVPLVDGDIFEFFPYGASVEVNPNNYDNFTTLFGMYRQLGVHHNSDSEAYVQEALHALPLSARSHLLSENYRVVLHLIREHLLHPGSAWHVRDEAAWSRLGVTYAVPFQRRIFPVDAGHQVHDPVPLHAAAAYVTKALETLQRLQQMVKSNLSLGSLSDKWARGAPPPPFSAAAAAPPMASAAKEAPHPTLVMKDQEKDFWTYVRRLVAQPSLIPPNKYSFQIKLPGGSMRLKENGEYIAVTEQNIQLFANLLESRREEVHRLFEFPGEEDRSSNNNNNNNNHNNNTNINSVGPSPYSVRYDTYDAAARNRVVLTSEDLNGTFFTFVRRLRDSYENGDLTEQQLAERKIGFYIPGKAGIFELIPGGNCIYVNMQNIREFFERVESERLRLETFNVAPKPQPQRMIEVDDPNMRNVNERSAAINERPAAAAPHVPRPPPPVSAGRSSGIQASIHDDNDSPYVVLNSSHHANAPAQQQQSPVVFLDEQDLPFLKEFEYHTNALTEAYAITDELHTSLGFKWAILVPTKNISIPLREGGEHTLVTKEDLPQYIEAVVKKIREIRGWIEQTSRYIVTPSSSSSPLPLPAHNAAFAPPSSSSLQNREAREVWRAKHQRDTAVPVPPSEAEKEMFSPTHNESGLFSPAQHISL